MSSTLTPSAMFERAPQITLLGIDKSSYIGYNMFYTPGERNPEGEPGSAKHLQPHPLSPRRIRLAVRTPLSHSGNQGFESPMRHQRAKALQTFL